jgi:hypothetical protein
MKLVLCLGVLIWTTFAFNQVQIDKARACMRLCFDFKERHPDVIPILLKMRSTLNPERLENKLLVDVFEYCRTHITVEDAELVKVSRGEFDWDRLEGYLRYNYKRYKTDQDLDIPEVHYAIRKVLTTAEQPEESKGL